MKVPTAVLSVSARVKARASKKEMDQKANNADKSSSGSEASSSAKGKLPVDKEGDSMQVNIACITLSLSL